MGLREDEYLQGFLGSIVGSVATGLCLKLYQLVNRQSWLLNTCFDREDLLSAYFVTLDTALNLTVTDATNQIQDTITLTNQLWISDFFSSFFNIFNIFMNCDESSIDRFRQAK